MQATQKKLALAGWLQEHDPQSYSSALKLQKFLFLYEAFSKAAGEEADFNDLYGFAHGPVYKAMLDGHKNHAVEFNKQVAASYTEAAESINSQRAEVTGFITDILSEDELSELSHKFNIWKTKRHQIVDDEQRNVALEPVDFSQSDIRLAEALGNLYPLDMIRNSEVIKRKDSEHRDVSFVFSKEDAERLTAEQKRTLTEIARAEPLPVHNPLFVEIDSDGCLVVD